MSVLNHWQIQRRLIFTHNCLSQVRTYLSLISSVSDADKWWGRSIVSSKIMTRTPDSPFPLQLAYLTHIRVKIDQKRLETFSRFYSMESGKKIVPWNRFECAMGKSLKYFFYYLCEFTLFCITVSIIFFYWYSARITVFTFKSKIYFQKIITSELKSVTLMLSSQNRKWKTPCHKCLLYARPCANSLHILSDPYGNFRRKMPHPASGKYSHIQHGPGK